MGFFTRKRGAELRLFFTTDIHGSERCFRKFLNAAKAYDVAVLVLGGDVTGKRVVPLVEHPDGFHGTLDGRDQVLADEPALAAFERAAADAGLYAWRTTPDGVASLDRDPNAVESVFLELAKARLGSWLELAAERLGGSDVALYLNLGNDDPFELDALIEGSPIATFPEGRLLELDGRRVMASVGYANQTPWHCARDIPEADLAMRIDAAVASGDRTGRQLVLNLHCPPYDSGIDTAPMLDDTLTPVMQGGHQTLAPVGSTAVRAAIERYRPVVSLHGHIHESRGVATIGTTLAINPGSEYPEGILRGAVVSFDEDGLSSYVLTSG